MDKINDGGPAFPYDNWEGDGQPDCNPGMSLRDWFAGMALQGYLSAHSGHDVMMPDECRTAVRAYGYADAMLEARKPKPVFDMRPIDILGLDRRTQNTLTADGLFVIGALLEKSWQELKSLRGFGACSVRDLQEKLQAHGLSLRAAP